jgi:rhodanese-related sulfurtransferase
MNNITPKALFEKLPFINQANILLVDVREPWEFEIAHIVQSILIPMNTVPDKLALLDKSKQIVCICHHGVRSYQVAAYLEANGFSDVINLTGGIHAWSLEIDLSMSQY